MYSPRVAGLAEKRLSSSSTRTVARVVEPHDYGIHDGVEVLLAYQVCGASRSGRPHGWKWFEVENMRQLNVLDRHFRGSRADSGQQHFGWDKLFARVK